MRRLAMPTLLLKKSSVSLHALVIAVKLPFPYAVTAVFAHTAITAGGVFVTQQGAAGGFVVAP